MQSHMNQIFWLIASGSFKDKKKPLQSNDLIFKWRQIEFVTPKKNSTPIEKHHFFITHL